MAYSTNNIFDDENKNEEINEINMIPLIDVMLVLLVIFMLAAPLSIGGIKVVLPKSKVKASVIKQDRIILTINKNGDYYISKSKVPKEELSKKIKSIFEFRENKNLYIRADKGVAYGSVVYAMSSAKTSGVDKLSMLTHAQKR